MAIEGWIGILALVVSIVAAFIVNAQLKSREKVIKAEVKAGSDPGKAGPAWDLARITLEAYFSRNISQITAIFWLSIFVMMAGFGIILWGISKAVQSPDALPTATIASVAGVLTEFIGATFVFVLRATIKQAMDYFKTLERINSVGMAMQILDTIPNNAKPDDLKNSTKALVVKMLMQQFIGEAIDESVLQKLSQSEKNAA